MTSKMAKYLEMGECCAAATQWLDNYDDPQKAWDDCHRPDWMWYWYSCSLFKDCQIIESFCDEDPTYNHIGDIMVNSADDREKCAAIRKLLPIVPLPESYEDDDI